MRLIDADELRHDIHMSFSDDLGILEHIDNAPTIDAQPVEYGKWIEEKTMIGIQYKCSNCGGICERYSHRSYKTPPYCMHCGADMRGNKNEIS